MKEYKHPTSTPNGHRRELSDELLMAYTEGALSPEQQRVVEELMSEEGPEADALEGLQLLHPAESKKMVSDLNRKLHHELLSTKNKRTKSAAQDFWGWIAVVIILILVFVAYFVIWLADKY